MAGLLVAEQIAGAANVEIVAGELEAGAEAVELCEHLQPLLRRFGDLRFGRRGQIGIGAGLRPPDAAAQLVELRQAEAVGAVDDEVLALGMSSPLSTIVVDSSTSYFLS